MKRARLTAAQLAAIRANADAVASGRRSRRAGRAFVHTLSQAVAS